MPKPHVALCIDLGAAVGSAPARVQLIPAGPRVIGRDGRAFVFDAEAAADVLAAFSAGGIALPIDRNHANEIKAPKGEESPAAGWIEALSLDDDGALWGDVTWTERGRNEVATRHPLTSNSMFGEYVLRFLRNSNAAVQRTAQGKNSKRSHKRWPAVRSMR